METLDDGQGCEAETEEDEDEDEDCRYGRVKVQLEFGEDLRSQLQRAGGLVYRKIID